MEQAGLDKQKLSELEAFVSFLEKKPQILHLPQLDFFRKYLLSLGAKIPKAEPAAPPSKAHVEPEQEKENAETEISEDELDSLDEDFSAVGMDENLMFPEEHSLPLMPPVDRDLTEEEMEAVAKAQQNAAEALEEGNLEKALKQMTTALMAGHPTALMFAKRANILLKLRRPIACIADCDAALKLNPDSGKAYRIRGQAYRAIGDWERAHSDLEVGQTIDYDEDLYEIQKLVAEKWKQIETKQRASKRRREERALRNKMRQRRRLQSEARKAYEAQKEDDSGFDSDPENFGKEMPDGFDQATSGGPGNFMGGAGGLGGLLGGLMGNPAVKEAMKNPKVLQAVMELMQNPGAMSKYQNDAEVMAAFSALMSSMNGGDKGTAPPTATN